MYEIELISFVDHKAADDFQSFTRKEREEATLDQIIAVASAETEVSTLFQPAHLMGSLNFHLQAGNDFFRQKAYGKAVAKYNRVSSCTCV